MAELEKQLIYVNVIRFSGGNLEPVNAIHIHDSCYKIISENDDGEHFPWEFQTGEIVFCEEVAFCENEFGLVAKHKCTTKNKR